MSDVEEARGSLVGSLLGLVWENGGKGAERAWIG